MSIEFEGFTQEEFVDYVNSFDDASDDSTDAEMLTWTFCHISIDSLINSESHTGWKDWIQKEKEMFISEFGYDRVSGIEKYWLSNPCKEPIIANYDEKGTIQIRDGYHRCAIAVVNGIAQVPVIIGS